MQSAILHPLSTKPNLYVREVIVTGEDEERIHCIICTVGKFTSLQQKKRLRGILNKKKSVKIIEINIIIQKCPL